MNVSRARTLQKLLVALGSVLILGLGNPCFAGMVWTARAIDPSLISAIKSDDKLLEQTLFGELPAILAKSLKEKGSLDLGDRALLDEMKSSREKRKAEVGDTEVYLDKAWHGIHYLLTGSAEANDTLASKVIMGGEDIGPDHGYGPAQLLKPDEVRAIAQLLDQTTPDILRKRYKPKEMTRADIYPSQIWARDGDEALAYVLNYYTRLVAFYKRAAERGQAVVLVIS